MTRTHWSWGLAALALGCCFTAGAASQEGEAPPRAEQERQLQKRNQLVVQLYQQGKLPEATQAARQALELGRQLYPKEKYPDGHPGLAASLINLGRLLQARGEHARAEPLFREA